MRRAKTIYCIAVIAIAVILASVGGLIGGIAAIVVLVGALPMFQAVKRASATNALIGFRDDCEATRHNQSTDRASENQRAAHQ